MFVDERIFGEYAARRVMKDDNHKTIWTYIFLLDAAPATHAIRMGRLIMMRTFEGKGAIPHSENWVSKLARHVLPQAQVMPPPLPISPPEKTWKDYQKEFGVTGKVSHAFLVKRNITSIEDMDRALNAKEEDDLTDAVGDILVNANVTPFSARARAAAQVVEAVQNILS